MRNAMIGFTKDTRFADDDLAGVREAAVLEERRRFAGELHDTLASGMRAVVLELGLARQALPANDVQARGALEAAERRVRACWADARRCAAALRPVELDARGLIAALETYAARLDQGTGTEVSFDACGRVTPLPADVELAFLRVAQEAVTNALRHAHARTIAIHLYFDETEGLRLSVADDDRGFDPARTRGSGSGLLTLRDRAARIGATITLLTEPTHGTEIILRLAN